ncbi:MAG: SRPBCC family protein [Adhaeribacter sp.]
MKTELPDIQIDREIITSRTLKFPRELVFSAWAKPGHLEKWWGPHGFTNTFEEFDFRPSGRWKFVMHGPDKGNYYNEVEFIDIDQPNFIYWKRHSKPHFRVAVSFEDTGDQNTRVTFRMIFDTEEKSEKLRKFVVNKNEENFDRLEEELQKML